jgi:hypothetical protein
MVSYWRFTVDSAARRLGTEQWLKLGWPRRVEGHVAEFKYKLHPWHLATLFMSPLDSDRAGWGRRLTYIQRAGHLTHLVINILLCWGYSLVSIHRRHKYLHDFCTLLEIYPQISSPNFLIARFPIMYLPSPWPSQLTIGHSPWSEVVYNHTSSYFSLQANWKPRWSAWNLAC